MSRITITIALGLLSMLVLLAACDLGSGGDGTVVTISAIPGVTVPVRGAVPVTVVTETEQYSGTVSWSPADNPFAASTVYTATITLTAKTGFTFVGVKENSFTVAGASTVTNPADSGVVTAVFPATGSASDIDVTFQSAVQTGGSTGSTDSTALTLSFDVDPTTLTVDYITVTGATKGALTGSGLTRILGISNITVDDGGTVSVTITSPPGYAITGSPKTAVVYRRLYIGMPYQGGVIAYILQPGDPGYVEGQVHGLIAAMADQSEGIQWAISTYHNTAVTGTETGLGTGSSNTDKIIAQNGPGTTYAAGLARAYNGGGYTDWYLPSKDELNKLYENRVLIGGFNGSLVLPKGMNPKISHGGRWYWSSSEFDQYSSWDQDFESVSVSQGNATKINSNRVRAVRSF